MKNSYGRNYLEYRNSKLVEFVNQMNDNSPALCDKIAFSSFSKDNSSYMRYCACKEVHFVSVIKILRFPKFRIYRISSELHLNEC